MDPVGSSSLSHQGAEASALPQQLQGLSEQAQQVREGRGGTWPRQSCHSTWSSPNTTGDPAGKAQELSGSLCIERGGKQGKIHLLRL